MIFLTLFIEFFKTGLFSVGGGLATIPFLKAMGQTYGWFDDKLLSNMIAVGESTPGPIGVNMATYVGFTVGYDSLGIVGAISGSIIATVGLVMPSVIVIVIVAQLLRAFKENKIVSRSFYMIRPAVTGMIAAAALMMIESGLFAGGFGLKNLSIKAAVLFMLLLYFTNKIKLHPIFYIIIAGAAGAIFSM